MPKRGENIRKRKDGRWEGCFISNYLPDGKAKYQSVYGKSYLETKRKLLQSTEKQSNGALPESCKSMSFREVLFLWLNNRKIKLRPQTYAKYSQMIENHLAKTIGSQKISKINTSYLNKLLEEKINCGRLDKNGGLSTSYVKTLIFIIQSAIEFAVAQGYCQPMRGEISTLPKKKTDYPVFSFDEQLRLESHMQEDMDGTKLGVLICLYTGLRIGELCGLQWSDIDFRKNTISVHRTVYRTINDNSDVGEPKTKLVAGEPKTISSYRDIPIPSSLLSLLQSYKKYSSSKWVVADDNMEFLDPRTYQYRFQRYLKDCAVPERNFHALRHAFASRCIEVGMDVKSLSEILGHASVNITLNTYVHSSMDQKRSQIELLVSNRSQITGHESG